MKFVLSTRRKIKSQDQSPKKTNYKKNIKNSRNGKNFSLNFLDKESSVSYNNNCMQGRTGTKYGGFFHEASGIG